MQEGSIWEAAMSASHYKLDHVIAFLDRNRLQIDGRTAQIMSVAPVKEIVDPLSARGIVLLGAGEPIVICSVDWVAISNAAHDVFREQLAKAAGTSPDRVAVHVVHQHDAPGVDFSSEEINTPGDS